ncbi:MAG: biotin/lipoate A/B protein ligase family protein [Kiritimatiellae bacterium]|jgi:lipoate-protein ligase A|nr:biotin/lipoate A/B protein ligase family protein [Kiritimatiellia bacterium]
MYLLCPDHPLEVYHALAMEQCLLNQSEITEPILFGWIGEPSVVLGKNQNPWRECNLGVIRELNLKLARRVSGGGAVYHDTGNLNLSWILPRGAYSPQRMYELLLQALSRLGISAEVGKGGVFRVAGKKIGGSAFCYRKEKVLHHGTLLLQADLARLKASLSPPRLMMSTHAVASLPAAVINLCTGYPEITPQRILKALRTEAEGLFGASRDLPSECLPDFQVRQEREQQASAEWIWGQTPRFHTTLDVPGRGRLDLTLTKGRVAEIRLNGTAVSLPNPVPFALDHLGDLDVVFQLDPGTFSAVLQQEGWDLISRHA